MSRTALADMHRKIADEFFDENIRIEKIIWLAGNMDEPSDDLCEFLEFAEKDELAALFGIKITKEMQDRSELLSALARACKCGFLVEVATPVPRDFHGDSGFSFSWGHLTTHWIYTEALDADFASICIAWKETQIAYYRERFEKESKAK